MRRWIRRLDLWLVVPAALVGTVAGHWLTYLVSIRDDGARHAHLHHTGHSYWPLLVETAAFMALAVAGGAIAKGAHGRRGLVGPSERIGALALRLTVTQGILFVAIEIGERLVAGASVVDLFTGTLLWTGLIAQALVALALALLIVGLTRTAPHVVPAFEAVQVQVRASGDASPLSVTSRPVPAASIRLPHPVRGPPFAFLPLA